MPTIFFKFGWRFYFVSFDCKEPPHIHVGDDAKKICKYWLKNGIGIYADSSGFTKTELKQIEKEIAEQFETFNKAFNEFCKNYKK